MCCARTATAEGRDYNTIRKTAVYPAPVLDDPATFVVDAKRYAVLAISQLDLTTDRDSVEYTERLAEIVPELAPARRNEPAGGRH